MKKNKKQNQNGNVKEKKNGVSVNLEINVYVDKIVRCLSITGVMIVGIIFGTSLCKTYLQVGGSSAIALLEKGKKFSE